MSWHEAGRNVTALLQNYKPGSVFAKAVQQEIFSQELGPSDPSFKEVAIQAKLAYSQLE